MTPAIIAKVRAILDSYTGVNEEATDDEMLRMFPDFTIALRPKKRKGPRVVVVEADGSERDVRL